MMRTYTNLAWPDDPYRTGQQLHRRPAPRLAAFTTSLPITGCHPAVASAAIVYLPLHRTRELTVTERTLAFGFRAASIDDAAEAPALAAVADLDLMQARRHAAILAGHMLPADLAALRKPAGGTQLRGLSAVQREWPDRHRHAAGRAAMIDCLFDLPACLSLEQACQQAGITTSRGLSFAEPDQPAPGQLAAAPTVERTLIIALVCARHLGRYTWEATLRTGKILAANAWDCFPQLPADGPAAALVSGATPAGRSAHGPDSAHGWVNDRHQ